MTEAMVSTCCRIRRWSVHVDDVAIVAHVAHVVADRGAHGVVLQGGCVCLQESLERFLFSLVLLTQFVDEIPEEMDFETFKSLRGKYSFTHLRFLTKMPLKIWASKLHDWSWSHGSIRTPSFVINLARKTISNPKPHNFYFYFILTPYNWVGNGNGKAEVVIAGNVTIMAVPRRRGRVVGLQVQPDHRGWGRGQVVGLQVELYHAAEQGAGSVRVCDSTVASALGDGDPVVDLWPLFFTR